MNLFDVYPLSPVTPMRAEGSWLWDENNIKYLDLYGGHAVISIGHSHPYYVSKVTEQLNKIGFYSNSVINPLQQELALKLGKLSGYEDYSLFLCNSGAEANENALKLASFHNGRKKVIAFKGSFHGRTSLAVAATNDDAIQAAINTTHEVVFIPLNDGEEFLSQMDESVCAVIVEGIQGVGGICCPDPTFLQLLRKTCDEKKALLILDEVQSGYGRTGKFFAHQHAGIKPDLITIAKGMGNGFPIGAVLIGPEFKSRHGLLGTTFGGSHLACAAAIAVLDVLKNENCIETSGEKGKRWMKELITLPGIKEVRGQGLMIGLEFDFQIIEVRKQLLSDHQILVGTASNKNVIRLLPALTVNEREMDLFTKALREILTHQFQATRP